MSGGSAGGMVAIPREDLERLIDAAAAFARDARFYGDKGRPLYRTSAGYAVPPAPHWREAGPGGIVSTELRALERAIGRARRIGREEAA